MARRGNAAKELAAAADTSSADALVVGAPGTSCATWRLDSVLAGAARPLPGHCRAIARLAAGRSS